MLTMVPERRSMNWGSSARVKRNIPRTLTAKLRSQLSVGSVATSPWIATPAEYTSASTRPILSSAVLARAVTWASSHRSTVTGTATHPSVCTSAATASISSRTSEARTTSAPSRAKRSAVERPMPRPAPVIRATFPCSFIPNPSPSGESMLAARTGRSERNGSTTWNEGGQGGARKRAVSDAGTDSRWAPTSGRRGRASCRCPPPGPGGLPRSPQHRHRPVAAAR